MTRSTRCLTAHGSPANYQEIKGVRPLCFRFGGSELVCGHAGAWGRSKGTGVICSSQAELPQGLPRSRHRRIASSSFCESEIGHDASTCGQGSVDRFERLSEACIQKQPPSPFLTRPLSFPESHEARKKRTVIPLLGHERSLSPCLPLSTRRVSPICYVSKHGVANTE